MVIDLLVCSLLGGETAQRERLFPNPLYIPFPKRRHGLEQRVGGVRDRTHENYMVI